MEGDMPPVTSKQRRKKKASLIFAGIMVGLWMLVGAGFMGAWLSSKYFHSQSLPWSLDDSSDSAPISAEESSLAEVVQKVSPSVVSIVTTKSVSGGYFQRIQQGAGTGIIISKDGYILTNKHVVDSARGVQVVSSDGTRYDKVEVVGSDPLNDLAFLKIENAKDLPAAKLGDSGSVRVGQRVIAIGNSLGQYQNTVTSGIISGLGRPVVASRDDSTGGVESLTDLLQTDAAINHGNSGGPLLDMAGRVIGVNTAIVSDAQSVGFAIPINASKGLIRGVLETGSVKKVYIGVQYVAITPDVRHEYDISEKQGALVYSERGSAIVERGPAAKAGMRDGDIITKVNNKLVGRDGGLGSLVAEFLPGESIKLTVVRDGKTKELDLTLGAYQSES